MNVSAPRLTTVTLKPLVLIRLDPIHVLVTPDTQGMVSRAQVRCFLLLLFPFLMFISNN